MIEDDPVPSVLRMLLAGLAALALLALLFLAVKASAHDPAHPELDGWYMGLKSSRGHMLCCDGRDATHLADVDWDSDKGHYRVKLEGTWYDVPDDAVIDDEPNRDGRALVWAYPVWVGDKKSFGIRCFMPGAGT